MIKKFFLSIFVFVLLTYFLSLSIWLNISPDKLTAWVNQTANKYTTDQIEFSVKGVVPRWSGIDVSQVLTLEKQSKKEILDIQYIEIHMSIFHFLTTMGVPFKAEIYNGIVSGKLQFFPTRISINVDKINIRQLPMVFRARVLPSPVFMDIESTIVLQDTLSGNIKAKTQQFKLSFEESELKNIIKTPEISILSFSFDGKLQNNKLNINASTTGDIVTRTSGIILINRKAMHTSGLNIQLSASMAPEFENKIDPLAKQIVKSFQNASGQIKLKIGGNLQYPKLNKN